jgi:hypothetical protein
MKFLVYSLFNNGKIPTQHVRFFLSFKHPKISKSDRYGTHRNENDETQTDQITC